MEKNLKCSEGIIKNSKNPSLAIMLIIGFLPILVLWLCGFFFWSHSNDRKNTSSIKQLRKHLNQIKREGGNHFYIQNRLNRVYGLLSENTLSSAAFESAMNRLNEDGLGFLKIHFFNSKAELINLKGSSKKYRSLISKVFKAISQPELENDSSLLEKYKAFISNFLGEIDPGEVVYEKSSLLKVKIVGKSGFFYWNTFYDKSRGEKFSGGMLAYFLESDLNEDFALNSLIGKSNRLASNKMFMGILDERSSNSKLAKKLSGSGCKLNVQELLDHVKGMRSRFESVLMLEDSILVVNSISAVKTLFVIEKTLNGREKEFFFWLKLISMIFLLGITGHYFNLKSLNSEVREQEILKLSFGVTFAMPLLIIFVLGLQSQIAFRDLQIQDNLEKLVSFIESVDENFSGAVYRLEKSYQKFAKSIEETDLSSQSSAKSLNRFCKSNHVSQLFIVDKNGRFKFSYSENKSILMFLEKFVPTLARKLFALKKGEKSSFKNQVNDMMVEKISENFSEFFSAGSGKSSFIKAFEDSGRISEFWMANKRYYVFSSFIEMGNGKPPLMMFIWQGTTNLSKNYLKSELDKNFQNNFKKQYISLAMVPKKKDAMPFPPEFSKYSFVNRMMDKVLETNSQQLGVETISGENWLVAASPLKQIPEYVLFAVYPESLVQKKIDKNGALLLALFLLCFSMTIFCYKVSYKK